MHGEQNAQSRHVVTGMVRCMMVMVLFILEITLASCSQGGFARHLEADGNNNAAEISESNQSEHNESDNRPKSYSAQSRTDGWGIVSDGFIDQFVKRYDELESYAIDELGDRKNAVPIHAALGEEVEATGSLAVRVLSVETGPYDYADNTSTVKVTVGMRNLTDKAISVKASNWDADNGNGQRVDHKLYIKDERGKRDVRSFEPTKVSPNATFTGVVYFDGESLNSIIYEPHWLVSSQNQYIYFDL